MKRPPSVISAIVFNSLIIGIGVLSLTAASRSGEAVPSTGPILVGVPHVVALIGLIVRGRWSWFLNIFFIGFWVLGSIAMTMMLFFQSTDHIQLIPGLMLAGFIGWLFVAIAFKAPARKYLCGAPGLSDQRPYQIAINHDDYHAKHIGRTADGLQFFLTTPLVPAIGGQEGCEFIARYLFDSDGDLTDATIDNLGPRATLDRETAETLYIQRLKELGEVSYCRIVIKPFEQDHQGTTFGLVAREPEDDEDVWAVELQPGNFMAFFAPWDSGDYDT